jgi:hypothetical protein
VSKSKDFRQRIFAKLAIKGMIWLMKSVIFNRQSILEVALLAVFAMGLFVSKIIVDYKNRIILGPGIKLASSGLTVHLPAQIGWRGLTQWQYERDNSFVLPATLMGRSIPAVEVLWKYILTSGSQNSRQVLEELASEVGSTFKNTLHTGGNCPMEYIIISASMNEEEYLGAIMLDFGRVLILQVKGQTGNPILIQDVFLALAGSLNYNKPDEMTKGVEFLEKARTFGTELFSSIPSKQYLIRDVSGNTRGSETIRTQMDSRQRLHIARSTSLATGVVGQREHRFESTDPLETFTWQCQNNVNSRSLGTFCLEFSENGLLAIEDAAGQRRSVRPGPTLAGELLLDWLVRYFLETEQQNIALDILYFDGQIIPAQIFLLSPSQAMGKTEELAFAVRVESLSGSVWEFYFDADKKLLGKISLEIPRKILLWDSVEAGEIERYFKTPAARKGPTARRESGNESTYFNITRGKLI